MNFRKILFYIIKKFKLNNSVKTLQNYECDKDGIVPPIGGKKYEKTRTIKR